MQNLQGKRVTVLGLGSFGGGVAAARWLAAQGAHVTATDAKPADELPHAADLTGVDLKLGRHDEEDFTRADLVVASPAVPPSNVMLQAARRAQVPITTEIQLLVDRLPTKLVFGVTGTKGKSTTAALLARILSAWSPLPPERAASVRAKRSGLIDLARDVPRRVWLGGNLGGSLLDKLPEMSGDDFVVLELSSYMLHHLGKRHWSPHIALITMVGRDHLAWHGSEEAYLEAKRNLVKYQKESDFCVVPKNSPDARAFREHTAAHVAEYGKRAHLPAAFAPKLLGKHNRINERGAYAAAAFVGIYPEQAAEACEDFAGLPHRLELVYEDERGVRWVNDSIATIPEAAAAACRAFPAGAVVQIVGGSDKGLKATPMVEALRERCRAVLCTGDTGEAIAAELGDKARISDDLAKAVDTARQIAQPGDVVLLSPGYASYDQFANFEARGDTFRRLVRGGA
jgi:UDP-N-acetylmuramoylalanine--D-glutamate ligase